MWERSVADPRHASRRPFRLRRRAGEGDDVERQRHLADYSLDLPGVGQARDEEAARAGVRERLAALDHLIAQRVVIGLRLEEEIGARVDEEGLADGVLRIAAMRSTCRSSG